MRRGPGSSRRRGTRRRHAGVRTTGVTVERAQTEGVNSAGGFLVPLELQRAIIAIREVTGAFRAAADVRPMGSDSSAIPRRTGGLTAYFAAESSTLNKSQAALDAVVLTAKKLATLTVTSSELD